MNTFMGIKGGPQGLLGQRGSLSTDLRTLDSGRSIG